jgi:transcriptional regulator of heat shock response
MKLSTGKVAFPLQFDNGDVENIFINPHDTGLQDRIRNFENSIKERLQKINLEKHKEAFVDGVDIGNLDFTKLMDMSAEELEKITKQTDAMAEIDNELEREFCAEIDNIFQSDVSSKAFKYVPPLAMVTDENGECELYILLVLKALAIEIQKYGNKMNNATNKYVAKYPKNI